jgi:hypothetical protein
MRQRLGHILGRSGVTKVRVSRWRCSFACFCGHRPASGGVVVGTDTTPADPGGERGVVHNKEGEREGGGSKAQMHTRVARESTAIVR